MSNRPHQIVLYGATGFTGALVAEYFAAHAPEGLRWAIAGRNADKLGALRNRLAQAHPQLAELPIVIANASDAGSLYEMAASADVVCTTVGPYLAYGLPLVEACAVEGTHYCDLTGEVPFIRRSIDAYHERAQETGARIVHACGYDSIPSDLGTWMLQRDMSAHGTCATRVTTVVGPSKGGVSGGTLRSMLGIMELAGSREARRAMAHPYALDPEGDHGEGDTWDKNGLSYDNRIQRWTGPFVMAAINTRVVRRSHALLGRPWGPEFSYTETLATGRGIRGALMGAGLLAGLGSFVGVAATAPGRWLLERTVLRAVGDGPAREQRESGYFRHLLIGETEEGPTWFARVIGHKDPGYGCTAVMLGEAALSLALDQEKLPAVAGVLTPTTAMGDALIERLSRAGMTWETGTWPEDGPPRL